MYVAVASAATMETQLDVPMSPDTIFENKMKKQKIEALKDTTKTTTTTTVNDGYLDADFVLGTNVIAERLFSTAKFVLTDQRLSLSPTLFNYKMLLKFNKQRMWNIATVARAIKGKDDNRIVIAGEEEEEKIDQLVSDDLDNAFASLF